MIKLCRKDKRKIMKELKKGNIDAADISFPNLIDAIILKMKGEGYIDL